ncbi:MAG: hypothetical protein CNE95_07230, partial [Puniceicoccaceae bacterium MED-G30]
MKEAIIQTTIAGNEIWRIGTLFAALLVAMIVGRILKFILNRQAKATTESRPILSSGYRGIGRAAPFLLLTIGLQAGIQFIHLNGAEGFVNTTAAILFTIAVGCVAYFVAEVPT